MSEEDGAEDFNFREHMDADLATHKSMVDIKDLNGLAKSYISGQELVGSQRLPLPPVDADAETMGKFYDSLGRPKGSESDGYGYDFSKTGELPEGIVKDEKMEGFFRKAMHENGLTQKQAEGLYNAQVEYTGQAMKGIELNQIEIEKGWDTKIREDWGLAHDEQQAVAKEAIEKFGDDGVREWFNETRAGNDPRFLKFAAKIGSAMRESGSFGDGGRTSGNQMTPDQAKTEIGNLQRNAAFMKEYNNTGNGHQEAVDTMQRLHDAAYPEMVE